MNTIKNTTMRITGGLLVRKTFFIPPLLQEGVVRPATDRIRESLFATLNPVMQNAKVLDLFAGSGSYGFESISRGALEVTFVEKNRLIYDCLQKSIQKLGLENCTKSYLSSAQEFLLINKNKYDIVFLDPPFALKLDKDFIFSLLNLLHSKSLVIFRYSKKDSCLFDDNDLQNKFFIAKEKIYGSSKILFLNINLQGDKDAANNE